MDLNCKFNKDGIAFSLGWLLFLILPSFLMVLKITSSFSLGLLLSSIIIMIMLFVFKFNYLMTLKINKIVLYLFVFLFYIVAQYLFNNLIFYNILSIDTSRFYYGIIGFLIVIFSCIYIAYYLLNVTDDLFDKTSKFIGFILILNAIISLFKIDIFNTGLAKPTFFYQEPSHFALVAAPFILYFTFTLKRKFCLLLLIFSAFWALYIQNATMLFIVLMASWVSLRVNFFYLILLLLSAVTLLIFSNPDGLAYFQERIILSSDSNNLSVLVLIQGWENALKTLQEFSIFGAGFQQFGVGTALGSASDKINQLIGFGLNLYDGGSLAPKIIGEFGILGILVIIYYCFIFISSVNKLKYLNKDSDKILIFSYCSIISVFVEIFIRGAGYFTPSLFMFLISLFYLKFFYLRIKFRS